jgi:hypothetical protein
MSSYVKPQVLVFQEFRIVPTEITEPLRAHIAGPHAVLHRYGDANEKPDCLLGVYDRLNDTCYPWPQRLAGSRVDPSYVKVYIDDAMLQYYSHTVGDNATTVTAVPGKSNWIQSSNLSFKANGGSYPRSGVFYDRDVQLGDVVKLRVVSADNDCEETVLETYVTGFASDLVPSRILPAVADVNNEDAYTATDLSGVDVTAAAGASNFQIAGTDNAVAVTVLDGDDAGANTYSGLVDGYVNETYTVEVIKSTISGCNAARLRVTSASGTDDQAEITPNEIDDASGVTFIGTRGLSVRFSNGSTSDNFVVGQKWQFIVKQTFEPAIAVSDADGVYATEDSVNGVAGQLDILGKYAGAKNDVYIIECTKGGTFAQLPEITVKTAKGLDFSGPTEVVGDGEGSNAISVAIGTNGVKVKFLGATGGSSDAVAGLRKGDKWYITVNSSQAGPVRKLILRDDLPTSLLSEDGLPVDKVGFVNIPAGGIGSGYVTAPTVTFSAPTSGNIGATTATGTAVLGTGSTAGKVVAVTVTNRGSGYVTAPTVTFAAAPVGGTTATGATVSLISGEDMDLTLYIKDDIQVSRNRIGYAPETNYWLEDTQVCVQEGIIAYHPEWTSAGAEQPLPVMGGKVYVEYREWLSELADQVNSISDVADLDVIKGQLHPDNPLKWGVYKALSNSNGTVVKYTAVGEPDRFDSENRYIGPNLDSWVQVLERIKGRDDMYNLVPLTFERQIQNLWAAHIGAESNEYANNWKAGFFSLKAHPVVKVAGEGVPVNGVLGTEIDSPVLATLADDPNATNTQYTKLTVTSGNGYFITNDVRPGDIVRYNFSVDGFGDEQYEEYVVDQVLSESTLLLYSGADAAVTQPQRVEIYHNRNRNEVAEDIAQQGGSLSNRRVCAVWPDQVGEAGTLQPGFYLASALAGLVSGVVPHQPLTNVEVAGFDDYTRSYKYFNETQLNRMAEAGVWIVTEDKDGTPHTRHALTTDNLDLNRREEMIRRNVDSMSYLFLRRLRPFIGRTNAQEGMVRRLRFEVTAIIDFLKANGFTEELGSQLVDGTIRRLQIHPLLKDRIEIVLDLVVPAPLNNIELHLVV